MNFTDVSQNSKPFSEKDYMDEPDFTVSAKLIAQEEPKTDKKLVAKSIEQIIVNYYKKFEYLLEQSKIEITKKPLDIKNTDKTIKQIEQYKKYWEYLDFILSAYENILTALREFKYSPTIKLVNQTIYLEVKEINFQYFMINKVKSYKKI